MALYNAQHWRFGTLTLCGDACSQKWASLRPPHTAIGASQGVSSWLRASSVVVLVVSCAIVKKDLVACPAQCDAGARPKLLDVGPRGQPSNVCTGVTPPVFGATRKRHHLVAELGAPFGRWGLEDIPLSRLLGQPFHSAAVTTCIFNRACLSKLDKRLRQPQLASAVCVLSSLVLGINFTVLLVSRLLLGPKRLDNHVVHDSVDSAENQQHVP